MSAAVVSSNENPAAAATGPTCSKAFPSPCTSVLAPEAAAASRSEEHTSELQSRPHLVCRLLLEKKKKKIPFPWHASLRLTTPPRCMNSVPRLWEQSVVHPLI